MKVEDLQIDFLICFKNKNLNKIKENNILTLSLHERRSN